MTMTRISLKDVREACRRRDLTYEQVIELEDRLKSDHPDSVEAKLLLISLLNNRLARFDAKIVADEICASEEFGGRGALARLHGLFCGSQSSSYDHTRRWLLEFCSAPSEFMRIGQLHRTFLAYGRSAEVLPLIEYADEILARDEHFLHALTRALRSDPERTDALVKSVKVLSLGEGCYGWLQLNRMGLRSDIMDESWLSPFNMLGGTVPSTERMLETRFSLFDEPTQWFQMTTSGGVPAAFHRAYKTIFNHECGSFLEDERAPLIDRYRRWARQFLQSAARGKRVFVLIAYRSGDFAAIERLVDELAEDSAYRLLIINCQDDPEAWEPLRSTTRYVRMPLPRPDYVWVNDSESPEGVDFDLRVRERVLEAMAEVERL